MAPSPGGLLSPTSLEEGGLLPEHATVHLHEVKKTDLTCLQGRGNKQFGCKKSIF